MFFIIFLILFLASLVLSVVFFVRYLITKKSQGCGIVGLVYMVCVVMIAGFIYLALTDSSDRVFIREFEERTALTFPASGVITDKGRTYWHLDRSFNMTIEMDSIDFMYILHEVQMRSEALTDGIDRDAGRVGRRLAVSDLTFEPFTGTFALYREQGSGRGQRFRLSFLDDKQTIRVSMYDI
jgi:hypothetical protein